MGKIKMRPDTYFVIYKKDAIVCFEEVQEEELHDFLYDHLGGYDFVTNSDEIDWHGLNDLGKKAIVIRGRMLKPKLTKKVIEYELEG